MVGHFPNGLALEVNHFHALLCAPLWLSKNPIVHCTTPLGHKRNIVAIAEPQRNFRLQVAKRFSYTCVRDIYEDIGKNPSLPTFLRETLDPSNSLIPMQTQKNWSRSLYKELVQVLLRVEAALINFSTQTNQMQFMPNEGIKVAAKTFVFPHIPRLAIKQFLQPAAPDPLRHPICQDFAATTPEDVTAFVRFGRQHRPQLLPIYDGLQLRIALRILPVRPRFWFLAQQVPNVQQCPYLSCNNIETAKYLFMNCRKSDAVWSEIWKDWSRFFAGLLTWTNLVLPHKLQVRTSWNHHQAEVISLWNMIRCIVLHHRWTERNRFCFEDIDPESLITTLMTIYSTFGAHYRRLLRHTDKSQHQVFTKILKTLATSNFFGDFNEETQTYSEPFTFNYISHIEQVLSSRH